MRGVDEYLTNTAYMDGSQRTDHRVSPLHETCRWTIVRGRFDKLPNNCQMLENNKVDADTSKKLGPKSEQSEAFAIFVKRVRTVVRTRQ